MIELKRIPLRTSFLIFRSIRILHQLKLKFKTVDSSKFLFIIVQQPNLQ